MGGRVPFYEGMTTFNLKTKDKQTEKYEKVNVLKKINMIICDNSCT